MLFSWNSFKENKMNCQSTFSHYHKIDHCVKRVHIRSYSGPYFITFLLNKDQNNSEYGHFLRSVSSATDHLGYWQTKKILFRYKNKVFVTLSLAFPMDKTKAKLLVEVARFYWKKLTKVKWETPKWGHFRVLWSPSISHKILETNSSFHVK